MKHIIGLRNGFVNLNNAGQDNLQLAMSINHQLMTYGYMLDRSAFEMVKSADSADIIEFHNEVIDWLKQITGGRRDFRSLYGNFPNDVMSMSLAELYWKQILHYWTACTFPDTGTPKETAFEHVEYKMLVAGDDARFVRVFTDLCSVNQSLTPQDQATINWFASSGLPLKYPDQIPFKENLAILASILPGFTVKTVTDVLRIAVGFSGGDVSLPAVPKPPKAVNRFNSDWKTIRDRFKFKLDGEQKDRIFELLENTNLDVREMNQGRRYGRWIRLGEVLGPIDAAKYPRTAAAFHRLRNQMRRGKPDGEPKIRTWYSEVNTAFKIGLVEGLDKLAERPGELVRRLDWLIRNNRRSEVNIQKILDTLTRVGNSVSNKVLYETYMHFENRVKPVQNRSIFIKGARQRTLLPDLPALPSNAVEAIQDTVINILKAKFAELPPMGLCWIDPELKKIPLPTNMRSMSDSLVPVIRGQRLPMATGKEWVRLFIHWYDERGTEDLDLHGFLLSENSTQSYRSIGYNGDHKLRNWGYFSGDVRQRRGPCAEYIDLRVTDALQAGFRYFVMVIHNFQGRSLASMKDCVVGVMEREFPEANEGWVPDTIANCMRPTSDSTMCLAYMYDLQLREYIHLDLDWNTFSQYVNGQAGELLAAVKPYIDMTKLSVYDLLYWHVTARGVSASIDAAETHFKFDDFKSSYVEVLKLMGI